MFIKYNMSRNKHSQCRHMIAQITFVLDAIPKKHIFGSFGLQFVMIIRAKERKTGSVKYSKVIKIWRRPK